LRAARRRCLYIGVIWLAVGAQAAPETIAAKVWGDRTALFPGDRLNYVARVEHSADVEFVADHVRKDQLSLDPFEVLEVSTASGDLPGGRKYFEVRLLLTTYDVSHADVAVPSFDLFYFRRGQATGKDMTPAETLAVPPLKIALRSTIPGGAVDTAARIREERDVLPVVQIDWMLPGVLGLCGLIAVAIYGCAVAAARVRLGRWKQKMGECVQQKSIRESFDEIRQIPVESRESAESFYARASEILRDLTAEQVGDCRGLTAREMQAALLKSGDREDRAAAVGDLMEKCDLVRYSSDGAKRARAGHPDFLRKFEDLVGRR
jgi:hypothetical protein